MVGPTTTNVILQYTVSSRKERPFCPPPFPHFSLGEEELEHSDSATTKSCLTVGVSCAECQEGTFQDVCWLLWLNTVEERERGEGGGSRWRK